MDVIEDGWLRTRRLKDGTLEVWSKGWRLEVRALPVVPAVLAVAFLMASAPLIVRLIGTAVLMLVAFIAQRLTKVGVQFSGEGVTVVDLRDTKHITWDRFLGFVGQRGSDDGHCAIALSDGSTVRFSAVLNAGDGDFYNAEDGLSLVDELNRLAERAQGRERPSSEPPAISIERIVLATAPRLLLDLEEDDAILGDAILGDEIEGADLAASIVFREPVVGVPVDIAMGEEPFFAEPPAERVGPEPIPVPEPIHVEEPIHVQEPVFIQEPVYSAEPIDISEPIDLSERIDVSEPAELPEPAIVVPEPVFTQSATTPRLHSRVLQELSAEVVASATAMPQADGTSPGARRLAAFLETQKPNEPLPAPVRRSLLAGLGRRRAERRERDSVTGAG